MNYHGDHAYSCRCGKLAHETRAMAKNRAHVVRGKGHTGAKLRTYQCEYDGWHITSQSAALRTSYRDAGMR
jgi:hypothetical protein